MLLRSLAAIGLVGDDGLPNAELVVRVAAEPGETFATTVGTYKRVSLDGGAVVVGVPGSTVPAVCVIVTDTRSIDAVVVPDGVPSLNVARAGIVESRPEVTCPMIVPDGERVFLQCVGAVGVRDDSSRLEVELPREAQADIIRLFTALGCSVQEIHG